MVPIWGLEGAEPSALPDIAIAAPVARASTGGALLSFPLPLSASGVLIVDADSGQTLYAQHGESSRPMASLTKLMTALLIVEGHPLDELVTVPADIGEVHGNVVHLQPGDRYTVGDLLSALLIPSANDAAVALAQHHSGSVEAFVEQMNARAQSLGLRGTTYKNPSGLDEEGQQSTPRDLAWLTMYVSRHPAIIERMGTRGVQIESRKGQQISLIHTHSLLHGDAPVLAGKTGTTDAAGQCLLSLVKVGDRRVIAILLGSADRYADMRTVLSALDAR